MEKLKYADLDGFHTKGGDDPALDEEAGTTAELCTWANSLTRADVPESVLERVKHLLLDGIACALVGGHVPWSEQCAEAIMGYEPPGYCSIIGYEGVSYASLGFPIAYMNYRLISCRSLWAPWQQQS
jgi:hypothetical protein